MSQSRSRWKLVGGAIVVLFVLAQVVPYGRSRTNPPVVAEPSWDSPATRQLARQACFDCHSNETQWPLYSHVAPTSWMLRRNVDEGRAVLNFSEWNRKQKEADEAAEKVREGEMPPLAYRLMHGHARLTDADRDRLARGLTATIRQRAE